TTTATTATPRSWRRVSGRSWRLPGEAGGDTRLRIHRHRGGVRERLVAGGWFGCVPDPAGGCPPRRRRRSAWRPAGGGPAGRPSPSGLLRRHGLQRDVDPGGRFRRRGRILHRELAGRRSRGGGPARCRRYPPAVAGPSLPAAGGVCLVTAAHLRRGV